MLTHEYLSVCFFSQVNSYEKTQSGVVKEEETFK